MISQAPIPITLDLAWHMLSFVPSQDRETWITVGMALKAEFGDDAFAMFDEWSSHAGNYDPRAVKSVWRSFNGGARSIGTLIHLAREHGWSTVRGTVPPRPTSTAEAPREVRSTEGYAKQLWLASRFDDKQVAAHPYSKKKHITHAAGARRGPATGKLIGRDTDCLIVPIRALETKNLIGVQCINPEGVKQTFGRVSGGTLLLGNTLQKDTWYVLEGWASGVAWVFKHLKGDACCAVSFGKSNQMPLAHRIAETYGPHHVVPLLEQDL